MKKWTLDTLERACREAFAAQSKLVVAPLPHTHVALLTREAGKKLEVKVDKVTCSLVSGAVHEMLHHVLERDVEPRFSEDLEEFIIAALEEVLVGRITTSRRRLAWWRAAINGKLPGRKAT